MPSSLPTLRIAYLIAATAVVPLAQAQAPASLSGYTYQSSTNEGLAAMGEDGDVVSVDLLPDGTFTTHFRISTQTLAFPYVTYLSPVGGTYTYTVTSADLATLTLTSQTGAGTLSFSSATAGVVNGGAPQFAGTGSFSISPTGGTPSVRALVNISTLAFVNQGTPATVGFVLGGNQTREVLIRVVGPTLDQFGIANYAPNPTYSLSPSNNSTADYPGESASQAYDAHKPVGWSATEASAATLAAEGARVGAFPLLSGSNDKADIYLLGPGPRTITVGPSDAAGSGMVLIEVYEVE